MGNVTSNVQDALLLSPTIPQAEDVTPTTADEGIRISSPSQAAPSEPSGSATARIGTDMALRERIQQSHEEHRRRAMDPPQQRISHASSPPPTGRAVGTVPSTLSSRASVSSIAGTTGSRGTAAGPDINSSSKQSSSLPSLHLAHPHIEDDETDGQATTANPANSSFDVDQNGEDEDDGDDRYSLRYLQYRRIRHPFSLSSNEDDEDNIRKHRQLNNYGLNASNRVATFKMHMMDDLTQPSSSSDNDNDGGDECNDTDNEHTTTTGGSKLLNPLMPRSAMTAALTISKPPALPSGLLSPRIYGYENHRSYSYAKLHLRHMEPVLRSTNTTLTTTSTLLNRETFEGTATSAASAAGPITAQASSSVWSRFSTTTGTETATALHAVKIGTAVAAMATMTTNPSRGGEKSCDSRSQPHTVVDDDDECTAMTDMAHASGELYHGGCEEMSATSQLRRQGSQRAGDNPNDNPLSLSSRQVQHQDSVNELLQRSPIEGTTSNVEIGNSDDTHQMLQGSDDQEQENEEDMEDEDNDDEDDDDPFERRAREIEREYDEYEALRASHQESDCGNGEGNQRRNNSVSEIAAIIGATKGNTNETNLPSNHPRRRSNKQGDCDSADDGYTEEKKDDKESDLVTNWMGISNYRRSKPSQESSTSYCDLLEVIDADVEYSHDPSLSQPDRQRPKCHMQGLEMFATSTKAYPEKIEVHRVDIRSHLVPPNTVLPNASQKHSTELAGSATPTSAKQAIEVVQDSDAYFLRRVATSFDEEDEVELELVGMSDSTKAEQADVRSDGDQELIELIEIGEEAESGTDGAVGKSRAGTDQAAVAASGEGEDDDDDEGSGGYDGEDEHATATATDTQVTWDLQIGQINLQSHDSDDLAYSPYEQDPTGDDEARADKDEYQNKLRPEPSFESDGISLADSVESRIRELHEAPSPNPRFAERPSLFESLSSSSSSSSGMQPPKEDPPTPCYKPVMSPLSDASQVSQGDSPSGAPIPPKPIGTENRPCIHPQVRFSDHVSLKEITSGMSCASPASARSSETEQKVSNKVQEEDDSSCCSIKADEDDSLRRRSSSVKSEPDGRKPAANDDVEENQHRLDMKDSNDESSKDDGQNEEGMLNQDPSQYVEENPNRKRYVWEGNPSGEEPFKVDEHIGQPHLAFTCQAVINNQNASSGSVDSSRRTILNQQQVEVVLHEEYPKYSPSTNITMHAAVSQGSRCIPDPDDEFVQQYDRFFDAFLMKHPQFIDKSPLLTIKLRAVKLRTILDAASQVESHLIDYASLLKSQKQSMAIHYQQKLLELSRKNASREIQLQQELRYVQSATLVMEGKLTWQFVTKCDARVKRAFQTEAQLNAREIDRNNFIKNLPEGNVTQVIRDAINAPSSVDLTDVQEKDLRQFQVDNAFLNAEVTVLEKKLAYQKAAIKTHNWVNGVLRRMDAKGMKQLKQNYQRKLGVSF